MMKKKPIARLTLLQEATESSKLGKTKTTKNRKKKTSRKPLLLFLIKLMLCRGNLDAPPIENRETK
jgi:accessory gene regulator protein AgrB